MDVNEMIVGLILDIIGVFILTLVTLINPFHRRILDDQKEWWKRYEWEGRMPFSKISPPFGKAYWRMTLGLKVSREGFVPPKHQGNIIGFLFVLLGFISQLKFFLS